VRWGSLHADHRPRTNALVTRHRRWRAEGTKLVASSDWRQRRRKGAAVTRATMTEPTFGV